MPTRIQCSACALIERLSASLALRRLSCIWSEIFTMPMGILWSDVRSVYGSYISRSEVALASTALRRRAAEVHVSRGRLRDVLEQSGLLALVEGVLMRRRSGLLVAVGVAALLGACGGGGGGGGATDTGGGGT